MTHTEALDLILSTACPSDLDGDVFTFRIDTHCQPMQVTARLLSTLNTIQYEIVSVTLLSE